MTESTTFRPDLVADSRFPFGETLERLRDAIAAQSFTIVFELDLQQRITKNGFEANPAVVLGVCNARHASIALQNDPSIIANLPCRIGVTDLGDRVLVATQNAAMLGQFYQGPDMAGIAEEVGCALSAILSAVTKN